MRVSAVFGLLLAIGSQSVVAEDMYRFISCGFSDVVNPDPTSCELNARYRLTESKQYFFKYDRIDYLVNGVTVRMEKHLDGRTYAHLGPIRVRCGKGYNFKLIGVKDGLRTLLIGPHGVFCPPPRALN